MERVRAPDRVRGTAGDRLGDPIRHVSGYVGEFGCSLVSEVVEEHAQCSLAAAGSGPHEATGVVIDHDDQVAVRPFVRDLIDPDPTQPFETIHDRFDILVDAADRTPDPHGAVGTAEGQGY